MTFKELQDLVLDGSQILQREMDFTLDKIKKYLNMAYYDFVRQTACMIDTIPITTVANQFSYSVSDAATLANVYKIYEVRYIQSGSTDVGYLLLPLSGGHAGLPRVKSYGIPANYWTLGVGFKGKLEIGTYPIISASSGTLKVFAYMFPAAALSGNADVPTILETSAPVLADYALAKLFKVYAYKNPAFDRLSQVHWAHYLDAVQAHNYMFAVDSADEFPLLYDAGSFD